MKDMELIVNKDRVSTAVDLVGFPCAPIIRGFKFEQIKKLTHPLYSVSLCTAHNTHVPVSKPVTLLLACFLIFVIHIYIIPSIPNVFPNKVFLQEGVVITSPNTQAGGPPPLRLSATDYSIYSKLPPLSEVVPLSAP